MGTFYVDVEIGGLDRGEFVAVNAPVNTGSTHTTMPESLLNRLEISPERNRRFELADGRVVEYPTGFAWVRYNGDQALVQVVFAPEAVGASIGATTLENLNLGVDPIGKRLLPVNNLMRRRGPGTARE